MPRRLQRERVLLVVIDDSPEMEVALRYASLRARQVHGRVAILTIVEPVVGDALMGGISDLMTEDRRNASEQLILRAAAKAQEWSGATPILYIREGDRHDELLKLVAEEEAISILVLAADTGSRGPGPLIRDLTGKMIARLRVPLTIVPISLSDDDIVAITGA
jgi:nucleotide-binding universal stress UspA family protein